jgi:hypothetical protein
VRRKEDAVPSPLQIRVAKNEKGLDWMSSKAVRAIAICALTVSFVSVVGEASAAGTNVIYNSSFSHGLRGWRAVVLARGSDPGYPRISVLRTPAEPILKCDKGQKGHPYLELNVPDGASGYVEQDIIVPVSPGRLTFRTWGDLEPVKASVSIVDGPIVHRLLSYNPPALQASPAGCSGLKPITESLNMTRYAGQAVGLRIQASSQNPTGTSVDFANFALSGG